MANILEPRYTPKEIAAALGVKIQQIFLFIESGELPAVNVAKPGAQRPRWKIRKSDWEAFEERRKNRHPDKPPKKRPRKKQDDRFANVREFY